MKQGTTVVLCLILAASGCANGGGTGSREGELTAEETQAVATFERGYPSSSWADGEGPREVHCLATGMVTDFGIDKLQKYGVVDAKLKFDEVSLKPMSAPDAVLFVDIASGCDESDFEADMEQSIREDFPSLSDSQVSRCVQAVTEDDVREAFEGYLREDPKPIAAFYRKLHKAGCGDLYTG